MSQKIYLPSRITVGELAERLGVTVVDLVKELMANGVMATINDVIDLETAQIIADELGKDVILEQEESDSTEKETVIAEQRRSTNNLEPRPPVIAVMGHVDHGKTTLIDAIRGAESVKGEAGGITQHISAYQIRHNNRTITLLDTPGHEAFKSLRKHGAHLTDMVILVVAADDGVKPQTIEAIEFAKSAGVKILVAINKIDKPEANVNRVLQELADNGLVPEAWGGDIVTVEVSAVKKIGIEKLLDMALLIADVEELKADASGLPEGLVIESHIETGRGPVVTLLVEHGQLQKGQYISAGKAYGRVRTLEDFAGKEISDAAGPSTPAIITGLKQLPNFGVVFHGHRTEKDARKAADEYEEKLSNRVIAGTSSELLAQIHKDRVSKEFPLIVKGDVKGSVESLVESIKQLGNQEIAAKIVKAEVGAVNENDITLAATSNAIIYTFNLPMSAAMKKAAQNHSVTIKQYQVIYDLIDDVKAQLESMIEPEIVENKIARLIVKGVFKISKSEIICGGEVTKGKITSGLIARVYRDKELIGNARVVSIKQGQQEVREVAEKELCGLQLETEAKIKLQEGDKIEFFTIEKKMRKL